MSVLNCCFSTDFSVGSDTGSDDVYPEEQVGFGQFGGGVSLTSEGIKLTVEGNMTVNSSSSDNSHSRRKRDVAGNFYMEPGRLVTLTSTTYYVHYLPCCIHCLLPSSHARVLLVTSVSTLSQIALDTSSANNITCHQVPMNSRCRHSYLNTQCMYMPHENGQNDNNIGIPVSHGICLVTETWVGHMFALFSWFSYQFNPFDFQMVHRRSASDHSSARMFNMSYIYWVCCLKCPPIAASTIYYMHYLLAIVYDLLY